MSDHATPGSLWDFWPDFWPDERSGDGLPHGDGAPEDGQDWPDEKPAA
jgi:hypothetical protein